MLGDINEDKNIIKRKSESIKTLFNRKAII